MRQELRKAKIQLSNIQPNFCIIKNKDNDIKCKIICNWSQTLQTKWRVKLKMIAADNFQMGLEGGQEMKAVTDKQNK